MYVDQYMKSPIINFYVSRLSNIAVETLKKLRQEKFEPFVSINPPQVYGTSILLLTDGTVEISDQVNSKLFAVISWSPEIAPEEFEVAKIYYEAYLEDVPPQIPADFEYMIGLGYFRPHAVQNNIQSQEWEYMMGLREKEDINEKRKRE
jgi:hypothetical protein